jgi:hypothetical protein
VVKLHSLVGNFYIDIDLKTEVRGCEMVKNLERRCTRGTQKIKVLSMPKGQERSMHVLSETNL